MKNADSIKFKNTMAFIVLGIFSIFYFWGLIISFILGFVILFDVLCNEPIYEYITPIKLIILDTAILYGIPIITTVIQFFLNKRFFQFQAAFISISWSVLNFIIVVLYFKK